jgi:hypothetical protein
MASDLSSLGRAFNRLGSGSASVSSGSSSTFSSSKDIDNAKHLSRATTQATLAAKSILASGGTQDTALKTAKAAAQATLLQSHIGTSAFTGNKGPSAFLCRRKIKRQSEVVASMALMTATNELNHARAASRKDDSTISKMSIHVMGAQETEDKPSPLTVGTTRGPLPTILSDGHKEAAPAKDKSENFKENENDDRDDLSRLSMDSAPPKGDEKEQDPSVKVNGHLLGSGVFNNSTDGIMESKDSSMTEGSSKPRGKKTIKELKKGALSLDSTENVEIVKGGSDGDNEAKENAAPIKESTTLVLAPSTKSVDMAAQAIPSPREKPSLKLVVQPTRDPQPLGVLSPMNSVKANLIKKKSLPKSILTPSDTYFTRGMNSPRGGGNRQESPSRVKMMESPRFARGANDDETCEPVYIMEHSRKNEQNSHSGSTRRGKSEDQSYGSSEGSSFFSSPSMDTYETNQTNQTFVTNADESEEPFFSVLSNMLKCGASLNRVGRGEKKETLTPHEKTVYKAWKNKSIIVDTNRERGDNSILIRSPRDPTTPGIKVSMKPNHNTNAHTSENMAAGDANAEQYVENLESGSSEMYTTTSHSSEEIGGYQRPRVLKSVKWRKALGLKPSRPKRMSAYEARQSIQQRTTVLEQTSSGQDKTYGL